MAIECFKCGICCIAADISTLGKPLRVRCQFLTPENLCSIYETRPAVCRSYQPDEVCVLLQSVPEEERVDTYLRIYLGDGN